MRELGRRPGGGAEYLGETEWIKYEISPYDGPATHRLRPSSAAAAEVVSRCASPARDDELDPLTRRNGQPAEFDSWAGNGRPRRRPRGAVPARGGTGWWPVNYGVAR